MLCTTSPSTTSMSPKASGAAPRYSSAVSRGSGDGICMLTSPCCHTSGPGLGRLRRGSARSPARLAGGGKPAACRLRHSVGIETKGGRFTPLIPKGTPLPASVTETFTTADLCQPSIQLKPFQGENPLASFNEGLGVFQ